MAGANEWMNNVKDYFQTQTPSAAAKTPYQQNVSQPAQQNWYKGDQPTVRETLGQIYLVSQDDYESGAQLQERFRELQSDPGSIYYAPYMQNTNNAIRTLGELGVDVHNINEDWC